MKTILLGMIVLTIITAPVFSAELIYSKKSVAMTFDQKLHTFISSNCTDIEKCFFSKPITLKSYPDQSPGFSLCYQLGGDPFFGVIKDQKEKEPICKKGDYFANHEALLYHYRDFHFKAKKQ